LRKFYQEHAELGPKSEEYAIDLLMKLLHPPEIPEEMDEKEISFEWKDDNVVPHLELFFSLCGMNHDLLDKLFSLYPSFSEVVRKNIQNHIGGLIKVLASSPGKLFEIFKEIPQDTEPLVLRIVNILAEKGSLDQELIDIIKANYFSRALDAHFLVHIIATLSKDEIIRVLPKFLSILDGSEIEKKIVHDVFMKLVQQRVIPATETTPESVILPILDPVDLLVAIHDIEDEIGLKCAVEATTICFSAPMAFNHEVLAKVIEVLVERTKLSTLLMRTVIVSASTYSKDLSDFVIKILIQLAQRKIWTFPKLWDGFIRCCGLLFPKSLIVILKLPSEQVKELLDKSPKLKDDVRALIDQLDHFQRSRREFQTLIPFLY
jgi:symplekin